MDTTPDHTGYTQHLTVGHKQIDRSDCIQLPCNRSGVAMFEFVTAVYVLSLHDDGTSCYGCIFGLCCVAEDCSSTQLQTDG